MAAFRFQERRTRRWWYLGASVAAAALFTVFFVASSGATLSTSPSQFEAGDGNMTVEAVGSTDWNCFAGHSTGFAGSANVGPGGCTNSKLDPAGAFAKSDPAATQADDSWVSGTKMDIACAPVGTNKNPGKDDFTNVASYTETASNKHTFLYGATIRVAPNGNASENVELNQVAGTSGCPITRTAGDELLAFDYLNGGTNLNLHVLTWITPDNPSTPIDESKLGGNNGTCTISKDNMPCWGANVLAPSSSTFEGQANQAAIATGDNGINGAALAIGQFAEFGVDLTNAIGASANTCETFAQTVWESRSSGSSFSSNPEDIAIEGKTISNCGGIVIRKVTVPTPDAAGTKFTFSDNIASATDTFQLQDQGSQNFGSSVQAGPYTVSELPDPGYTLSNIDCSASSTTNGSTTTIGASGGFDPGDTSISINLAAGDTIDCTYTNTLRTATLATSVSNAGPVTPGTQVRDTATVTGSVSTINPSATVLPTFFLCSFAAGSTSVCDTGGTNIGSGTLASSSGGVTSWTSPYVNTSTVPITAGRYCFRAEWAGDTHYVGALKEWGGTSGTSECFTVSQINTQTVTTPNDGTHLSTAVTTITLGSSIYDTAVVTGTAAGNDPTGSVVFSVCQVASPGTCASGGTLVGNANGVTLVSDGVANTYTSSATSVAFTPPSTGRYCFRGDYGGSTIYNASSDSAPSECFTVTDTTGITSAQTWLPNDSATLSSTNGATLSGTLSFTLYDGPDCGIHKSDGTVGTVVLRTAESFPIASGTASPVTKSTTNGTNNTVNVTSTEKTSWKVVFTSNDPLVTGFTRCESSNLTVTN
jgi:hypothetical protein